jgi:hypothetical protein
MTDCELMRIENKAMQSALRTEHELSDLFVAYLLGRNIRYEADLVDQLFNSSEKRLARILLLLAHFGKEGKPERAIPKISQETLAEMVGTTRSRVSFFMNRFRKLGFIKYNGELEVHSSLLKKWRREWLAFQETNLIRCGSGVVGHLSILPVIDVCPQTLHTTQGISNGLPLFGGSAVIHGKHMLPFAYFRLGCLKSLLHLGPVCFENRVSVGVLPSLCHVES